MHDYIGCYYVTYITYLPKRNFQAEISELNTLNTFTPTLFFFYKINIIQKSVYKFS